MSVGAHGDAGIGRFVRFEVPEGILTDSEIKDIAIDVSYIFV